MGFHLSLPVRSLGESEDFYVRVLGASITHRDPSGYINVDLRGIQLTLKEDADAAAPGGDFHFGFNVDANEFAALLARTCEIARDAIEGEPRIVDAGTPLERRKLYLRSPCGYRIEIKSLERPAHHVRLWRYRVDGEHREAFIRHYHVAGSWAELFRQSPDYIGTQLWIDENDDSIFYTADYWRSRNAFEHFSRDNRMRYAELDARFEKLTLSEEFLGAGDEKKPGAIT